MPANNNKHTDDTKKIVIDLFKQGFNARKVSEEANKLCKDKIVLPLTRNACMGIKRRADMCTPNNREYVYPKRRNSYYNKNLAFNEHKPVLSFKQESKRRLQLALEKYNV